MIFVIVIAGLLISGIGYVQQKETSPSVLWMNGTFAVLTELNGADYTIFGTVEMNEENKQREIQALSEWWDVTDRTSADETLDWLLREGHRKDYVLTMQRMVQSGADKMTQAELLAFTQEVTGDETKGYYLANAYYNYKKYGPKAIDAWDYCRAMSLISWYYVAGYYSESEAMNKSLEVAQIMQTKFSSWDALMDSYFRGYEYWAESSSDERRSIYEEIKTRSDSPYHLNWNLVFNKN